MSKPDPVDPSATDREIPTPQGLDIRVEPFMSRFVEIVGHRPVDHAALRELANDVARCPDDLRQQVQEALSRIRPRFL